MTYSIPMSRLSAPPLLKARPDRSCALTTASTESPPAPVSSSCKISYAESGASRATWSRTVMPSATSFSGHHYRTSQAQSSAISLERGMDNECADFFSKVTDDHDYKPFIDSVRQGYLSESTIDTALIRLMTARIRLGMFDPPEIVPFSKIDEKMLDSAEHRALARKLANESIVLLKNDGTVPLKPAVTKIAVVGPLADQTRVLLGNYNGTPSHSVSMLDGLKAEFPNAKITSVPGTQFLRNDGDPVPNSLLTTDDGKPGLKAAYTETQGGPPGPGPRAAPPTPITSRIEPNINLSETSLPAEAAGKKSIGVEWNGFLVPPDSGDYLLGIRADGFARVSVDGRTVAQEFRTHGVEAKVGRVHLDKGQKVRLSVNYINTSGQPRAELIWARATSAPSPEAVAAARNADVVIAAVGITSQLEGEEMQVTEPGFLGGDRTSIDLPDPEEALIEAVAATGKPLVVVLMNGSALAVK